MEDIQDDEGARLLRRAKEIIGQRGWGQRSEVCVKGSTCAAVAIGTAERELYPHISSSKIRALHAAYSRLYYIIGVADIIGWNDDAHRTLEEVLKAFDEAIALKPPY